METCICSYLPKVPVINTDPECSSLLSFENETAEKNDGSKDDDRNGDECNDNVSLVPDDDILNEDNRLEIATSMPNVEISASKILVLETKNWIICKKVIQAEAEVESLQEDLQSQWSLRNQLNRNIEDLKNEKQKWTQEIQKSFTKHVNERNRLIQEIAEIRQRLLYITKSVSLTESKNIELENEKKDTAHCLKKSIVERRSVQYPISKNVEHNISTTSTTDSDASTSSYTGSSASRSTSSTDLYPMNMKENKNLSSISSGSGITTELESESPEYNDSVSSIPNDGKRNDKSMDKKNAIPDHMRLDLSFLENPNHIDSGFSEANNLASKNSLGDYSTTNRMDDINIFI